jgi:hypothetical protein
MNNPSTYIILSVINNSPISVLKGTAGRGTAAPAIPYPDNYFALPIPNGDIEKSDNLVQNKGY